MIIDRKDLLCNHRLTCLLMVVMAYVNGDDKEEASWGWGKGDNEVGIRKMIGEEEREKKIGIRGEEKEGNKRTEKKNRSQAEKNEKGEKSNRLQGKRGRNEKKEQT